MLGIAATSLSVAQTAPPSTAKPESTAPAPLVVVVFRLAAEVNNQPLEAPFNAHLNHHKVGFFIHLRDLAASGAEADPKATGARALPKRPSDDYDRKAGWAYLTLAPGRYSLQFEWLAEGLAKWDQTRATEFSVPGGATAIYIGTVTFTCTDKTSAFAAHRSCEAPKIIDESSAASAVVQHSLAQAVAEHSLEQDASPTNSLASHLVIPSRATAAQLDTLSHNTNIIADVLTVDRREYLLQLDGTAGGALSGPRLSPETVSSGETETTITRIPFEQLALVYYFEAPHTAKPMPDRLVKDKYPSVAAVGGAEQALNCSELDLELARAGTIRWYARQHPGVLPFTEHEAGVQHGKNALKYTGEGLLLAVVLIGSMGGGGGGGCWTCSTPTPPDLEALRWAVTAADRRELGLLQLKEKRTCPAVKSPDGATTDLEILSKIGRTREALGAHKISDLEQRDQQTQLLDQLDPPSSATVRVASASEFAAAAATANQKKGEQLGGAALTSYRRYALVEVKSSSCAYPSFGWPLTGRPTQLGGPFYVREHALTWTRQDSEEVESLQFKDIEELRPTERHYGVWFIPIRKASGSCLFINVGNDNQRTFDHGRTLQETARSTMLGRVTQSSR